jgi:hypothetical protein
MVASRVAWTSRTLAPWCAAAGLLISFTADAGQEAAQGASRGALAARAAPAPEELVPVRRALDFDALLLGPRAGRPFDPTLVEARLVTGSDADLRAAPDETPPRADMKPNAGAAPAFAVDRTGKGGRPSIRACGCRARSRPRAPPR